MELVSGGIRWGMCGGSARGVGFDGSCACAFGDCTLGSGTGVGRCTLGGGDAGSDTLGGGAMTAVDSGRLGDGMTGRTRIRLRQVGGGGTAVARCYLLLKRVARVNSRGASGGFCVGVGAVGGTIDATFVVEVATLNIAARCFIAAICSVPKDGDGDTGDGLSSAAVNSRAASVAASAEDVAGMGVLWGKNSTEREILSARVLGM